MRFERKCKFTGQTYKFWAPDNGGYIRLEGDEPQHIGMLGEQLLDPSYSRTVNEGTTMQCSGDEQEFISECKRWCRARLKRIRRNFS